MSNQLIISEDGSHTLSSSTYGVTYHSKYGSIQETNTVFIDAGLLPKLNENINPVSIFEMGFGTGLNALVTYLNAKSYEQHIIYETIEAFPITMEVAAQLNYPDQLNITSNETEFYMQMHAAVDGETIKDSTGFSFTKHITTLQEYAPDKKYDIIYYDAFAPTSQEELWTPEMMQHVSTFCKEGTTLVTYCAKGSFKRALRSAGFKVEALPGPIGKREMTRAVYKG